jgi:hypothetical protein
LRDQGLLVDNADEDDEVEGDDPPLYGGLDGRLVNPGDSSTMQI